MATPVIEKSGTHTRSVKYCLQHTWVIDNFSNFYLEKPVSTDPEYPEISSTSFNCSQDKRIQFALLLYPKGNSEESKDYISVYLNMTFKELANIPIKFTFSILNARNEVAHSARISRMFNESIIWGTSKFVERMVLLDKTKGMLPDDKLTLLLKLELYSEPVNKSTGDTCVVNLKSLSIAKNSEMIGDLLESGYQSDIVLVLDGRQELKAHKAILSTRSPVFKAMFEADMKEKAEGRVVIEDLTIDVAKELLKFIYTGSADLVNCSEEELLSAADKYGLDLLKQICGQFMIGQVTTENVARFLVLADRHSIPELKSTCFEYIHNHFIDVMLTQDWSLVDKQVVEELRQLMLKETVTDKSESAK